MPIYKINENTLSSFRYNENLYESHEVFKNQTVLLAGINDDESSDYKKFLICLDLLKKQYNLILKDLANLFNTKYKWMSLNIETSTDINNKFNLGAVFYNKNKVFHLKFISKAIKNPSYNDDGIYIEISLKNNKYCVSQILI